MSWAVLRCLLRCLPRVIVSRQSKHGRLRIRRITVHNFRYLESVSRFKRLLRVALTMRRHRSWVFRRPGCGGLKAGVGFQGPDVTGMAGGSIARRTSSHYGHCYSRTRQYMKTRWGVAMRPKYRYRVTIKGSVPANLSEKIAQAHAAAILCQIAYKGDRTERAQSEGEQAHCGNSKVNTEYNRRSSATPTRSGRLLSMRRRRDTPHKNVRSTRDFHTMVKCRPKARSSAWPHRSPEPTQGTGGTDRWISFPWQSRSR